MNGDDVRFEDSFFKRLRFFHNKNCFDCYATKIPTEIVKTSFPQALRKWYLGVIFAIFVELYEIWPFIQEIIPSACHRDADREGCGKDDRKRSVCPS